MSHWAGEATSIEPAITAERDLLKPIRPESFDNVFIFIFPLQGMSCF
jgi:hypothetical protein